MLVHLFAVSQARFALLRQALEPLPFAGRRSESDWTASEIAVLAISLQGLCDACPGSPHLARWVQDGLGHLADGTFRRGSLTGGGGWMGAGSHPWRLNMDINRLSSACVGIFLATHGQPEREEPGIIDLEPGADPIFTAICRLRFTRPVFQLGRATVANQLPTFGDNDNSDDRHLVFTGVPAAPWPQAGPEHAAAVEVVAESLYGDPVSIRLFGQDMALRMTGDPTFQARVAAGNRHATRIAADLEWCRERGLVLVTRTRGNGDHE